MSTSSRSDASAQQENANQVVDNDEHLFAMALVWSNPGSPATKLLALAIIDSYRIGKPATRECLRKMTGLRLSNVDAHLLGAMKLVGRVLGR